MGEDVNKLPEELRCCTVCLEDIERGQQVRTLPCLHTFHAGCAEEWLKKKKLCPLCQFSIDGDASDSAVAALEGGSVAPYPSPRSHIHRPTAAPTPRNRARRPRR